jgi:hypothetical protein
MENNMTLMKDAPLPTFGNTITSIVRETLGAVAAQFGMESVQTEQRVVRAFVPVGDRVVGVRLGGAEFEGLLFVSANREMIRTLRGKLDGESNSINETESLFGTAFELFKNRAQEYGCPLNRLDDTEPLIQKSSAPEEWLVSQLVSEVGAFWISFGYSGKLPFSAEEERKTAAEAKDMTFF